MSEYLPFTVKLRVEDGQLVAEGLAEKMRMEIYLKNLADGTKLEITYEVINDDASYGQLSKIHACIRELSRETGHSPEEIKMFIKQKAGLYSKPGELRSFANCSKKEMSSAIEATIQLGDELNVNLNQY